jgi:5-(carboxyamino)imidazole ribonucleotide mutase
MSPIQSDTRLSEAFMQENQIQVAIVMGSNSDWPVMRQAAESLADFGIAYEAQVVSAHRTPELMFEFAENAQARGIKVIIAGAGGAAHLPGMIAAKTTLPVLGVPVPSRYLKGQDSLLSIVQMPKGVPVATFAIGEAGAANAGLFAISMLAIEDAELAQKLSDFRETQKERVFAMTLDDKP